jgi:hypothetical protein
MTNWSRPNILIWQPLSNLGGRVSQLGRPIYNIRWKISLRATSGLGFLVSGFGFLVRAGTISNASQAVLPERQRREPIAFDCGRLRALTIPALWRA